MFAADIVDLEVALIGAVAVIAAATIPAWLGIRKTRHVARSAADAIGTPNGQGTVVEMLERSLENQGTQREQLRAIQAEIEAHTLTDHNRFRTIFQHLGIDYSEATE